MREGYKDTVIGMIPEDWEVSKLGEIAITFAGGTPNRNNKDYFNGIIPWVKSGEVNSRNIHRTDECITERAIKEAATRLINPNSVLVALYGATVGNVGILRIEACSNQAVLAVNSKTDSVTNDFIYYWLKQTTKKLISLTQGSGQPNLSKEIVDTLNIPIPTFLEQSKIATILSTVDDKIDAINERIAKTQQLKSGLLQTLLTKGIGHAKFKDSPLGEIPESWEVRKLSEIAIINDQTLSNDTDPEYAFYYVDLTSVKFGKIDFPSTTIQFRNAPSRARRTLKNGDVIMATVRPNLLGYAIANFETKGIVCSTGFAIITPLQRTVSQYIYQCLYSESLQGQIQKLIVGSNYPAINSTDVANLRILYPPYSEQQEISKILSTIDEKLDVLKEKKTEFEKLKQGLMQKLLSGQIRVNTIN